MTGQKTPRERWQENGTTCPFCGNEEYTVPCSHMLADFSTDTLDEDGVLGPGWTQSALKGPSRNFGLACLELLRAVWQGASSKEVEARQKKLKELTKADPAGWWGWVIEAVDDSEGDEGYALGYYSSIPVGELVADVPGVLVSEAILGGMTSSNVYFLWSEDREAGTRALEARIGEATEEVRRVTEAISAV